LSLWANKTVVKRKSPQAKFFFELVKRLEEMLLLPGVELTSGDDVATRNVPADYLLISTPSGSSVVLAIDKKTHLPIATAYDAFIAARGRAEIKNIHVQIHFAGYRSVKIGKGSAILLPHQITKTIDGEYAEDMYIKKYLLNINFSPKIFQQKKR
jgi:hypothetical protein